MRVTLIGNADERCGNSEYSRFLRDQLLKRFEVDLFPSMPEKVGDIVLVNYHPAVVWFGPDVVSKAKVQGAKVAVIVQESRPTMNAAQFAGADLVMAHEPVQFIGGNVNFRFVHHGAPEADFVFKDRGLAVGTAGFAFPGKRMEIAAKAAQMLGGRALVVAPRHAWFDPTALWSQIKDINPTVMLQREWLPVNEVVYLLAQCAMNVWFAEEGDAPGQGGSPRMILAARRPTILRRCPKVSALFPYEDEIYFVNTEQAVYDTANTIWVTIREGRQPRIPNRVLDDIGWDTVGERYCDLIEQMFGKAVAV